MAARRHRRRAQPIRFRLTLAGWALLGISLLVGVAAVKSQTGMMFVVFGGMMGALHMSAWIARRTVAAVRVRRDLPSRAWQNQTVHLGYFLRNDRRRGACLGLDVREHAPEGLEGASGHCVHLPAKGIFRAGARFAVRRRGRIDLRGTELSTRFPFGLIRAGRLIESPASLVVWPARGRLRSQLLRYGAVETSSAAPSPKTGGQDEFFGLREYRPGDNPRWIHWRRSANRTAPVIREMARPLPEVLWVVLDSFYEDLSGLGEQAREQRIRFAATLIDYAFARGYQVGLALAQSSGVVVHPPAAGRGHRTTLLDALADVDDNTTRKVEQTIAKLRRDALGQSQAILITEQPRRLADDAVAALRAACRHLTIIGADRLAEVFEDDPLAGGQTDSQEAPCP